MRTVAIAQLGEPAIDRPRGQDSLDDVGARYGRDVTSGSCSSSAGVSLWPIRYDPVPVLVTARSPENNPRPSTAPCWSPPAVSHGQTGRQSGFGCKDREQPADDRSWRDEFAEHIGGDAEKPQQFIVPAPAFRVEKIGPAAEGVVSHQPAGQQVVPSPGCRSACVSCSRCPVAACALRVILMAEKTGEIFSPVLR